MDDYFCVNFLFSSFLPSCAMMAGAILLFKLYGGKVLSLGMVNCAIPMHVWRHSQIIVVRTIRRRLSGWHKLLKHARKFSLFLYNRDSFLMFPSHVESMNRWELLLGIIA